MNERPDPAHATPVIDLRAVQFSYGDFVVLDGADVHVHAREFVCIVGPNGGGKTTLFRILCTLLRPTSGQASILGHSVITETAQVRRCLGTVFQSASLDGKLTVAENLRHQGHLYGLFGRQLQARIRELLEVFRLTERARDRVQTLSGGLARRVDLAKGVLHRPHVLLLDEPSTDRKSVV